MKKLITAIALLALCSTGEAQVRDTIAVNEKFIIVAQPRSKAHPEDTVYTKIKCDYIVREQGYYEDRYYVNGKEMKYLKYVNNTLVKK